ncbi:hypothetical protein KI387_015978 [Taxus chinensis]|uniref:BHLH domain-containing protein n=1 Tax=Taxus chinensis TaxID=29808 RepID=A0AA38GDN7_TAXCH|nr:hypothetical protein KI387_015978 [Taxus chinensis]
MCAFQDFLCFSNCSGILPREGLFEFPICSDDGFFMVTDDVIMEKSDSKVVSHSANKQQLPSCSDDGFFFPTNDVVIENNDFKKLSRQGNEPQLLSCSDDGLFLPTNDVVIENSDFKKLSHNANERQRRKKLNELYATLRSLLPHANTKKKLGVPAVVSGVLKYIPRLQNQIVNLARKRDQLLTARKFSEPAASSLNFDQRLEGMGNLFDVGVNINPVTKMEVVVTIQSPPFLFSNLLVLFNRENLDVLYASTFVSDHMVWHTIQLKVTYTSCNLI